MVAEATGSAFVIRCALYAGAATSPRSTLDRVLALVGLNLAVAVVRAAVSILLAGRRAGAESIGPDGEIER